jgi:hypothetical protein
MRPSAVIPLLLALLLPACASSEPFTVQPGEDLSWVIPQ